MSPVSKTQNSRLNKWHIYLPLCSTMLNRYQSTIKITNKINYIDLFIIPSRLYMFRAMFSPIIGALDCIYSIGSVQLSCCRPVSRMSWNSFETPAGSRKSLKNMIPKPTNEQQFMKVYYTHCIPTKSFGHSSAHPQGAALQRHIEILQKFLNQCKYVKY